MKIKNDIDGENFYMHESTPYKLIKMNKKELEHRYLECLLKLDTIRYYLCDKKRLNKKQIEKIYNLITHEEGE